MPDAPDPKDHTEQIKAWREAGWLVRVLFYPLPRGHVTCTLEWLDADDPAGVAPSPKPYGAGPTVASAVERCAASLERNRIGADA